MHDQRNMKRSPGRNLKKIKVDDIKMNKVNAEKLILIFNILCTLILIHTIYIN